MHLQFKFYWSRYLTWTNNTQSWQAPPNPCSMRVLSNVACQNNNDLFDPSNNQPLWESHTLNISKSFKVDVVLGYKEAVFWNLPPSLFQPICIHHVWKAWQARRSIKQCKTECVRMCRANTQSRTRPTMTRRVKPGCKITNDCCLSSFCHLHLWQGWWKRIKTTIRFITGKTVNRLHILYILYTGGWHEILLGSSRPVVWHNYTPSKTTCFRLKKSRVIYQQYVWLLWPHMNEEITLIYTTRFITLSDIDLQ